MLKAECSYSLDKTRRVIRFNSELSRERALPLRRVLVTALASSFTASAHAVNSLVFLGLILIKIIDLLTASDRITTDLCLRYMNHQLTAVLSQFRLRRDFRASEYLWAKCAIINDYFKQNNLTTAIVGVSGGVDSAVTLGILKLASKQSHSPIKQLIAALLPIENSQGTTNQECASARGRLVATRFGARLIEADLSTAVSGYKESLDKSAAIEGSNWAEGQLASYSRTPALFYLASLYTEKGQPGVVCGTTNRDEGAYIGFFGKASDGMVDLQIISDLHKSEVYTLGQFLDVPQEILDASPSGDTFDGRSDLEMIGANYDAIELYQNYLCLSPQEQNALWDRFSEESRSEFNIISNALESLHRHNRHKYRIGSQAIHFDLYPRAVPGGWTDKFTRMQAAPDKINIDKLVAYFEPSQHSVLKTLPKETVPPIIRPLFPSQQIGFSVPKLLSEDECAGILTEILPQNWQPVAVDGRKSQQLEFQVGSYRATTISHEFASAIWERIRSSLPIFKCVTPSGFTDGTDTLIWRAIGINPVLRFISYAEEGELIPHYDAGYDFKDGHRHTLMSLIIYLNDAPASEAAGQTRFIKDSQRHKTYDERNFRDWEKTSNTNETLLSVTPKAGNAIAFDHRLLHDCSRWHSKHRRTILRTDIVFERCGNPSAYCAPSIHRRPKVLSLSGFPQILDTMSSAQVDDAFRQQLNNLASALPSKFFTTWKVLRDSFYRPIFFERQELQDAFNAGFFEDSGDPTNEDTSRSQVDWLVTPLHKLQNRLQQLLPEHSKDPADLDRPLLVLLSTGSFCPVHEGHIQMLKIARQALEAHGETVLGGYLSPSNDEYVKKKCGAEAPSGPHRLELCESATSETDWLMVDPWEALHCDYDVNFTVTIDRLEDYLNHHLKTSRPIQVVYVFGSDNANFMLTFVHKGRCVCVPRPSYEQKLMAIREQLPKNTLDRIHIANDYTHNASSTKVRSGDFSMLESSVLSKWESWQRAKTDDEPRSLTLGLRDEGNLITKHWSQHCPTNILDKARNIFLCSLLEELRTSFLKANWPEQRADLNTRVISLQEQLRVINDLNANNVISLDPLVPARINLGVSRCFELVDGHSAKGIINRPGWPDLAAQIKNIPNGKYILLDDDHCTGTTENRVRALIGPHCEIIKSINLVELLAPNDNFLDLGDSRDFLVGAWEGGLVSKLPNGEICRAPYLYPYVRPSQRLSLPISQDIPFSLAIWEQNKTFFASLPAEIKVEDCPRPFQALATYLGFKPDTKLSDFCDWHIQRLSLSKATLSSRITDRRGTDDQHICT